MTIPFDRRAFVRTIHCRNCCLTLPHRLFRCAKKIFLYSPNPPASSNRRKAPGCSSASRNRRHRTRAKHGFDVTCSKDAASSTPRFPRSSNRLFSQLASNRSRHGQKSTHVRGRQTNSAHFHRAGLGFVGCHAASDTFHTEPDAKDLSNRYIAHGAAIRSLSPHAGGEFIIHGRDPRLQTANIIINDPAFPARRRSFPRFLQRRMVFAQRFRHRHPRIGTVDTSHAQERMLSTPPYPVVWPRT